ncbi:1-acyl-sn-glycerol-3-phosphate acyltransferase 2 [Lathyrus oleraceus]|uniref:1-acylglycerol-3-phosphate O-acyltransferase n=1 Tax=Pisum sativum TaxID=3888 RepID=A0A9D4VI70_PEA|nr:1-acyl-sn-glycerol-3-phosphate acyltransferase 2 [Pisum sativum]
MAFPATIVVLPLGTLFILSGLIVNVIQSYGSRPQKARFRAVWPEWPPAAREEGGGALFENATEIAANADHTVYPLLFLFSLRLYFSSCFADAAEKKGNGEEEREKKGSGKENALLICNHRSDIDWLIGWVLAERMGCLGSIVAIMKNEIKYLPVLGWSMWFADFLFLARNWAKDEKSLKTGFEQQVRNPVPFWLALFAEGTRFTQTKLIEAQEFARSRGMPIPKNVLVPRTKGFVTAVMHTRTFVPVIYDCTFTVSKTEPSPTMLRIFQGIPCTVKVQAKRHKMEELPETADGIAQWCKDLFVAKDALLEQYNTTDIFSEFELQKIRRHKRSIMVVLIWSCLLGFLLYKFFKWSSLLSTWQGILLTVVFLIIVSAVMETLIHSSQSESSKPADLPIQDPIKQRLLQK